MSKDATLIITEKPAAAAKIAAALSGATDEKITAKIMQAGDERTVLEIY